MIKVKCPQCKKEVIWESNPFRPFCSEFCKSHDLGKWANEEYRVPVEELDGGDVLEDKEKKKTD
jgi:endogenous inhibitor of DNA gyrase (YacG/DUF329 family)